jgi:arabinogalactan endo-1,4-beta-galactosidase
MITRCRLTACIAVLAGLLTGGCASARVAPRSGPPVQVGVNSDITWGIKRAGINKEVHLIAAAGVRWVRVGFDLSSAEYHRRGKLETWYINQIDYAIRAARHAGLEVLMEVDRTPYWASADPHRYVNRSGLHWNNHWRYRHWSDYAKVVADVVTHYKAFGVHAYELWNEPNWKPFWPTGPDPRDYAALLKAAYPAVKRVDPQATVLMGGLSSLNSYTYLQGMYNAGARGYYDAANFHVYPENGPHDCLTLGGGRQWRGSLCLLQGLHDVMVRNHDRVRVWATEFGWSTCRGGGSCVSPAVQGRYIKATYEMFQTRPYQWVQNAFVYEMHDLLSTGDWSRNLQILKRNYAPKPAYFALRSVARSLARVV